LIVRSFTPFEIRTEGIKRVFNAGFALDDVAKDALFDLIRNEGVMDQLQLSRLKLIELNIRCFPFADLPEFFAITVDLQVAFFSCDERA
jgi:hypothetical protein